MELQIKRPVWFIDGDEKLFQDTFEILCEQLNISQFERTVELSINIGVSIFENAQGSTTIMAAHDVIPIMLSPASMGKMLDVLSHEMVHVRQQVSGEETYNEKNDSVIFDGIEYSSERLNEIRRRFGINSTPWETDAYRKAPDLMVEVEKRLGIVYLEATLQEKERLRFKLFKATLQNAKDIKREIDTYVFEKSLILPGKSLAKLKRIVARKLLDLS